LSRYILGQGAFGTNHALRDRENLSSLAWWNVYGGGTPQLQRLATRVLSQVVNTSSAERYWSTYNFIHNVKRNRLNAGRAKSLVYVHYNLRLLYHYCEEAKEDTNLNSWDNHLEEDNFEDGVMLLEKLENDLFDDDDHAEMPPPPTTQSLVPLFRTPTTVYCTVSSFSGSVHYHHMEAHTIIVLVEGGWDSCLMFPSFHYFTCQSIDDRFIAFSYYTLESSFGP
jgi:hypothetical protein